MVAKHAKSSKMQLALVHLGRIHVWHGPELAMGVTAPKATLGW